MGQLGHGFPARSLFCHNPFLIFLSAFYTTNLFFFDPFDPFDPII